METKPSIVKAIQWQKRIQEQKSSGQSKAEFCREQNLSRFQFDYWLKRSKKVPVTTRTPPIMSPFIRAEVVGSESPQSKFNLDPKWVAEFILHLQGGAQ